MAFDYFYGPQAEQFAFYRIPKVLFTDGRFGNSHRFGERTAGAFCAFALLEKAIRLNI